MSMDFILDVVNISLTYKSVLLILSSSKSILIKKTNEGTNWVSGMTDSEIILFKTLAAKYLWWMTPDEALKRPERIVIQVMNLGDFADVTAVLDAVGEDQAREFLTRAEAGQFSPRSWHYWHYRLGLAETGGVPPMPTRRVC